MAQSPQQYIPAATLVPPVSKSWTTTGNTDTITDESIEANSIIVIMNTSASNGKWYVSTLTPTSFSSSNGQVTISAGTATITSSDSETAGTTYKYMIF